MDELLLEAFRHNAWATRKLLEFCRGLPADKLTATTSGVYGNVVATFNHIIYADAGYLPRKKVTRPDWARGDEEDVSDLAELERRAEETGRLWERYLADPLDAKDLLSLDQGAYEAQSSVPVAQALHHANVHREQICSILTAAGIEPPDLQVWAYAEEVGHAREVPPAERPAR